VKEHRVEAGDILVVVGLGPVGSGMPETYQLTSALKYLSFGKTISLITDGRFSGVSTGACIGHISPEAWAGGRSASCATAIGCGSILIRERWPARWIMWGRMILHGGRGILAWLPTIASRRIPGSGRPCRM